MKNFSLVVLDLGGTKLNVGRYRGGKIEHNIIYPFDNTMTVSQSIAFLSRCIEELKLGDTQAITIGVPSIVNVDQGVVFNAGNIKSWQEVPLKNGLNSVLICQYMLIMMLIALLKVNICLVLARVIKI
jgi:glucokinase